MFMIAHVGTVWNIYYLRNEYEYCSDDPFFRLISRWEMNLYLDGSKVLHFLESLSNTLLILSHLIIYKLII